MTFRFRRWMSTIIILLLSIGVKPCFSQKTIELTLDTAVGIAISNSYEVRQLQLSIERTRKWLEAERAGLRSRVYMNITAPEFESLSDYKWNSDLRKDELIRENTRLWQMNLAIRQPVILFGYPTNGYLSLNNRIRRYAQRDGQTDINYYNRYYLAFEQPLFQPNHLKNELEMAEIDLEQEELDYLQDLVDIVDDLADDYFDLLELAYQRQIHSNQIRLLEQTLQVAEYHAGSDSTRVIALRQVRVELANARERIDNIKSQWRIESSQMKQNLRLSRHDSLIISPDLQIEEKKIALESALQRAFSLHPEFRENQLEKREEEIELENTKGDNSFRLNLEMTYGLEKSDRQYQDLWESQDNSYTVALNAYIPIWDWGERRAEIQARQLTLKKRDLYIEETRDEIEYDVRNTITNLREYQRRSLRMKKNLALAREIAEASIQQYREDAISLQELFQNFTRQKETAQNFLEAYLGYRSAMVSIMEHTYYDFDKEIPLTERFKIDALNN